MEEAWRSFEDGGDAEMAQFLAQPWGTYRPNQFQRALIALTQNTLLQRGKSRTWMAKLIMSLGSPLDVEFRGCKYRIEPRRNLVERGILTRPKYNASEIEFLKETVRDGGVMLDIGCNVGLSSLPIAKAAVPNGQVLALDANSGMVAHLVFNAEASGLTNINAQHVAVGDCETRVSLQSRKNDGAIVRVHVNETGTTEMRPLLRVVEDAGLKRVDGLKIDIEGHEDKALVPFLQSAPEEFVPRRIVIERASRDGDYPGCVAEFERLGFKLVGQTRNNSMYERSVS